MAAKSKPAAAPKAKPKDEPKRPSAPGSRRNLSDEEKLRLKLEYGRRIRQARIAAGYATVPEAAKAANMGDTVWWQMESGRNSPGMATLDIMIREAGLDPAILFKGPGTVDTPKL